MPRRRRSPCAGVAWCLGLDRIPRAGMSCGTPLGELAGTATRSRSALFEAVPGLVVPALVYRPTRPGPIPAVVHAPGPLDGERAARARPPALQRPLARAGARVLCVRPARPGRAAARLAQHGQLAPLLVGFTSLGVMVAETLAALDVLAARGDVDADRLGVIGASGGGFVSTFAAAVDVASGRCICCILNTHVGQLRDAAFGTGWDGWIDLCNQVPRLAATAKMGVVVGAAAPRAVTVVHAVDDPPFPIAGARAVVAEAATPTRPSGPRLASPSSRSRAATGCTPRCATPPSAALAAALGGRRPAPSRRRRCSGTPTPSRTTSRARELARRPSRPRRLPGESLPATVDTNPVLVALARAAPRPARPHAVGRARRRRALGAIRRPGACAPSSRTTWRLEGGFGQRLAIDVAGT